VDKEDVLHSDRDVIDLYYANDLSETEAWRLIIDSMQYLDDNVNISHVPWSSIHRLNVREKVAIIENHIGIKRDGNPIPLSIWEKIFYGNYKRKLTKKIDKV